MRCMADGGSFLALESVTGEVGQASLHWQV